MSAPLQMINGNFDSQSLAFVEGLYAAYVDNPESVGDDWRRYFDKLAGGESFNVPPAPGPSFRAASLFDPPPLHIPPSVGGDGPAHAALQERVDLMIRNFRVRGHMAAQLDPLGRPRECHPELEPAFYGFDERHMEMRFSCHTLPGPPTHTLREIIDAMQQTYCRSIGVQYMHIDDMQVRNWLQERMEGTRNRVALRLREQIRILVKLTEAVVFEEFLQRKFVGAKSFSLSGAETLIPLLDMAIDGAGACGVSEVIIGMAHRGRLNVLANIMGKSPRKIFREFEDQDLQFGRGDVKYHLGHSTDWESSSGQSIHLSLCFNPSHLEYVDPVAVGRMRAKQDRMGDERRTRGLVILIHGDAAFAGEGVVQETLQLSELPGYRVGGTLHVIVNNQIGFTTPPEQGRSSMYASGMGKMLQIPILHVNGEDPEAVAQVVRLALDFRARFQRDVILDMYCYRRHGHNESDEPAFTQPLLYHAIRSRRPIREGYLEHLLGLGGLSREEADEVEALCKKRLEEELSEARSEDYREPPAAAPGVWSDYHGGLERSGADIETAVSGAELTRLMTRLCQLPEGFHVHRKIQRLLDARLAMGKGEAPLDWAAAEALALASLLVEGRAVRLSGQDTERGTFSQRHAVIHDMETGGTYMSLAHLDPRQARVEIINSPLSEAGVLGFEYGYSLDFPEGLVAWEAQFGDFVNCGQVIIDQFIASAEDKWHRLSGVVLLLPHGFEGQGPEHSSARLERFLAQAAEDNIQVVNLTTPAQYFHCLRRQVLRRLRKPLVVMTPKSLLRHPQAVSDLASLSEGKFQRVIADDQADPAEVRRVLLCSGKIYYELAERRHARQRRDAAVVRVEQLYPLPYDELAAALRDYADGTPVFWVQEEPENMGAWRFWLARLGRRLFNRFSFAGICRPESASPATGSHETHVLEQRELIDRAFGD